MEKSQSQIRFNALKTDAHEISSSRKNEGRNVVRAGLTNRPALTTQGKLDWVTMRLNNKDLNEISGAFPLRKQRGEFGEFSQGEYKEQFLSETKRSNPHYIESYHWFTGAAICRGNKSTGNTDEILVNIGGVGLELMRESGYSDHDILSIFAELEAKCTRLDFCVDFFDAGHWKKIERAIKRHHYATNALAIGCVKDGRSGEYETYYIGSRKNRTTLLCIYDKATQMKKVFDQETDGNWYRIELRNYNGSKADKKVKDIDGKDRIGSIKKEFSQRLFMEMVKAGPDEMAIIARGRIMDYFRIVSENSFKGWAWSKVYKKFIKIKNGKRQILKNIHRFKTAKFWKELIESPALPLSSPKIKELECKAYKESTDKRISRNLVTRVLVDLDEDYRDAFGMMDKQPESRENLIQTAIKNNPKILGHIVKYGIHSWTKQDQDKVNELLTEKELVLEASQES